MKKLVTFKVLNETYSVYGDIEIEKGKTLDKEEYIYPEFYGLSAVIHEGEEEKPFSPSGTSWNGHKYDASDMINDFILHSIIGTSLYTEIFVDEEIKTIITSLTDNTADINGEKIPKQILSHDMYNLFELALVTDRFIYYWYDSEILMLNAENREIVSNNYFAEVGFWQSVENINKGEEILLWGTIPEE